MDILPAFMPYFPRVNGYVTRIALTGLSVFPFTELIRDKMNQPNNVIDLDQALELAGGDQELLDMVLRKFWSRYPELLAAIRQAIEDGDCTAGRDAAHSLKGNAAYLCASELGVYAQRMEQAFREGQLDNARAGLAELDAAGERLRASPAMIACIE